MALAGLPALVLLHDDFWLRDDARIILGLPAGMLYHVFYCLAATGVMMLLVFWAWPDHLEVEPEPEDVGERP